LQNSTLQAVLESSIVK